MKAANKKKNSYVFLLDGNVGRSVINGSNLLEGEKIQTNLRKIITACILILQIKSAGNEKTGVEV